MKTTLLVRKLRSLTITTPKATLKPSIPSLSHHLSSSFSTSSSSSSSPPSRHLISGAAADAVDDDEDEDEHFMYGDSSGVKAPVMNPTILQPRVVIYDGVCHLCHRGVKWVIKADKYQKLKFCCLQSKAAEPYLRVADLDRKDVLRRFLFVEGPGMYHQGSTAALRVMSYLPLPYSALSSLMIVPAPLRDAVYDYIAKHRYKWFGKTEECLVLKEKEMLERFIDREEILDRSQSDL